MITLKKTEEQLTNEVMGKISLSKDKDRLGNNVVNLSKAIINLSKEKQVDISATVARVVAVIDYSGSMSDYYASGDVQNVIDMLIPLGMTFDDDGTVQVYKLTEKVETADDITLENYSDYINSHFRKGSFGGTRYSPSIRQVIKDMFGGGDNKGFLGRLFSKKDTTASEADSTPVFVLFITDGKPYKDDEKPTFDAVRESAEHKMFIQFVGVNKNKGEFELLQSLDDFTDRKCDNTGFVQFNDIKSMTNAQLYNVVLEQYADWLKVQGY